MAGNFGVGIACCVLAGVFFGSNYIPVKKVNVGDGVFFSACMAIGILLVGVVVNWTLAAQGLEHFPHGSPQFEPKAAVGGMFWMLGNFMCPWIVKWVGLGLGLAIWDCVNLLTGWATGAFGLFGVWQEEIASPKMNRFGVALACVSLVLLAFACDEEEPVAEEGGTKEEPVDLEGVQVDMEVVQSNTSTESIQAAKPPGVVGLRKSLTASTACSSSSASLPSDDEEEQPELSQPNDNNAAVVLEEGLTIAPELGVMHKVTEGSEGSAQSPPVRQGPLPLPANFLDTARGRMMGGFVLSLATGFLFGLTFDWPTDLMEDGELHPGEHSTNPMDYVLSSFVGIAATGVAGLAVYLAMNRGESFVPKNVILPAIASGAMWGVAQVAWFQANLELSMVVAFPIISTLPGIVGMLWGWALFGEFRGDRSRRLAATALCLRVPAVVLIGLSNVV